jgi:hypothetical protein
MGVERSRIANDIPPGSSGRRPFGESAAQGAAYFGVMNRATLLVAGKGRSSSGEF